MRQIEYRRSLFLKVEESRTRCESLDLYLLVSIFVFTKLFNSFVGTTSFMALFLG